MKKVVYISRGRLEGQTFVPFTDRFSQVDKLNDLVSLGWRIVRFVEEDKNSYFILEKEG